MPDPKKYKRDAVENGDEDRGVVAMAGGIVALAGGRAEGEARLTRAHVEMSAPRGVAPHSCCPQKWAQ